jgi:glycosyltransferase involved in cell wall biosynthesis
MEDRNQPPFDFCLLIPYFNSLAGLNFSLESLSYDPLRFVVLIIDDGSKDALRLEDLSQLVPAELLITIVRLPGNRGITEALNKGLEWLEGNKNCRFVARLDCGDLCREDRFHQQIQFLDSHPDIDMVGSWCLFKNFSSGWAFRYKTPIEHEKIVLGMYFRNVFRHSTVMWRAELIGKSGFYPYNFPHAEDYGFFYQILNNAKAAIIPQDLVICEINPKSISVSHRKEQLKSRIRVIRKYGQNKVYTSLGVIKLWCLLIIPYKFILQTKRFLYGIKHNDVILSQKSVMN